MQQPIEFCRDLVSLIHGGFSPYLQTIKLAIAREPWPSRVWVSKEPPSKEAYPQNDQPMSGSQWAPSQCSWLDHPDSEESVGRFWAGSTDSMTDMGLSAGSSLVSQDDPVFGQADAIILTPAFLFGWERESEDSHPFMVTAFSMCQRKASLTVIQKVSILGTYIKVLYRTMPLEGCKMTSLLSSCLLPPPCTLMPQDLLYFNETPRYKILQSSIEPFSYLNLLNISLPL